MLRQDCREDFFYKNPIVRSTLDKALEQQVGMTDPRKNILDMAMDNEIVVSFFIVMSVNHSMPV